MDGILNVKNVTTQIEISIEIVDKKSLSRYSEQEVLITRLYAIFVVKKSRNSQVAVVTLLIFTASMEITKIGRSPIKSRLMRSVIIVTIVQVRKIPDGRATKRPEVPRVTVEYTKREFQHSFGICIVSKPYTQINR